MSNEKITDTIQAMQRFNQSYAFPGTIKPSQPAQLNMSEMNYLNSGAQGGSIGSTAKKIAKTGYKLAKNDFIRPYVTTGLDLAPSAITGALSTVPAFAPALPAIHSGLSVARQGVRHFTGLGLSGGDINAIVDAMVNGVTTSGRGMNGGKVNLKKTLNTVKKVAKQAYKTVEPILRPILSQLGDKGMEYLADQAANKIGDTVGQYIDIDREALKNEINELGRKELGAVTGFGMKKKCCGGGAKKPVKRRNKRGELVAKVMKQEGMTLKQASEFIKEHGLY